MNGLTVNGSIQLHGNVLLKYMCNYGSIHVILEIVIETGAQIKKLDYGNGNT